MNYSTISDIDANSDGQSNLNQSNMSISSVNKSDSDYSSPVFSVNNLNSAIRTHNQNNSNAGL